MEVSIAVWGVGDYHIKNLSTKKCKELVGTDVWNSIKQYGNEQSTNAYIVSIEMNKRLYEKYAGNQDYSKNFQK